MSSPARVNIILGVALALWFCPLPSTAQQKTSSTAIGRCLGGDTGAMEQEQLQAIVQYCSTALGDKSIRSDQRAGMLVNRGVAFRNLGKLQKSLSDLDQAVKIAPRSADASRMRAWTLREMRQARAAEAEYDRALTLEKHWQVYLSRCVVRIDMRKYAAALQDCEQALTLERNADSLYFTAFLRSKRGDAAGAISILEEASRSDQAPARVFLELGNAYMAVGERQAAKRTLDEGLSRFPDDAGMIALLEVLNR